MEKKGKLELTWVGKYEEEKLEPRILIEDKSKSYGDPDTENMLIHGDNLLALKALEQKYIGKIKCIYIDPPYNTGSRINAQGEEIGYEDGLEHSIWLSMMYNRLLILQKLLSDDGVIYIQIDDNEQAYLKIICDEIFGRQNYITTICLRMSTASGVKTSHRDKTIIKEKEMILVFCKNKRSCTFNPQYIPVNVWDDEFQYYLEKNNSANPEEWEVLRLKDVLTQNGLEHDVKNPKTWSFIEENSECIWRRAFIRNQYKELSQNNPNRVFYSKDKEKEHYYYRGREMFFLSDKKHDCFTENGTVNAISNLLGDFWTDINTGKLFNEGGIEFRNGKKPEFLIARILNLSSNKDDFVLDCFLGSGSTAAVAHKMGRKWIGIEMADHCYSHCVTRMNAVIEGEQTGVSNAVNWQGGGGYKFYELAEPLLVKNSTLPVYQINPSYTWDMVCEAICKIEGFTYEPSGEFQGYSSENRFIHITEEFVNTKYVMTVMKSLGVKQSLLIYCKKNQADMILPENVEVKKIPKDLLDKCDFESEVQE